MEIVLWIKRFDPRGQATVLTQVVHPSTAGLENPAKIAAGPGCSVGLAEWIIDDFCLVIFLCYSKQVIKLYIYFL